MQVSKLQIKHHNLYMNNLPPNQLPSMVLHNYNVGFNTSIIHLHFQLLFPFPRAGSYALLTRPDQLPNNLLVLKLSH